MLFGINDTNGDSKVLEKVQLRLLKEFPNEQLIGVEFGVAYGGGVEQACRVWGGRGHIYGFDTFTGHPKHQSVNPAERDVMDGWYAQKGTRKLSKRYIERALGLQGFKNFTLIEVEIGRRWFDLPDQIHYALLDLDMITPMRIAYERIRYAMAPGGYICVHDVLPPDHLPEIYNWWYGDVMPKERYKTIYLGKYLGVYRYERMEIF